MTTYISELEASLNDDQKQSLIERGFKQIPTDLNTGAGGNHIYLWYKKGHKPITRIQVSFNDEMATGLIKAGYKKMCLNAGAGVDNINIWYYQGSGEYDTPIVEYAFGADVKGEDSKFRLGWEKLAYNLDPGTDEKCFFYLWLKREKQTYICDITATDSYGSDTDLLKSGYTRVDENINRGAGGSFVFIWYRQTTDPKRALTDLQVSISNEETIAFLQQGFTPVSVNLNDKTGGNPVYVWYKKGGSKNPIKAIDLLVYRDLIEDYIKAGLIVIVKNLNAGNEGYTEYLCVYQ